eukprot:1341444-Pyramimonas_sp.AAC.1
MSRPPGKVSRPCRTISASQGPARENPPASALLYWCSKLFLVIRAKNKLEHPKTRSARGHGARPTGTAESSS